MSKDANYRALYEKAMEITEYGSETINHKLRALFVAIEKETEKGTEAHDLAAAGRYLAEDMGNLLDVDREELQRLTESTEPAG
ncbi:MAG TPA: hypothetical protein VKA64_02105 [Gammaproteobacteria bacterium]|nr:hypothetical protein [Gammaproteobacteria bacterium]